MFELVASALTPDAVLVDRKDICSSLRNGRLPEWAELTANSGVAMFRNPTTCLRLIHDYDRLPRPDKSNSKISNHYCFYYYRTPGKITKEVNLFRNLTWQVRQLRNVKKHWICSKIIFKKISCDPTRTLLFTRSMWILQNYY